MSTISVLKSRLADAEDALHNLETGQRVSVFVDQNGERVEYQAANSSKLRTYIAELNRRINAATRRGQALNRPMKVYF